MNTPVLSRDPSAFLSRWQELYKAGKLKESRIAFNQAIAAGDNADGYYSLGVIDFNEGHFEAAVANLEQCLRMDPSHSNAYFFLGEIAERQNRINDAEVCYRKAVTINPTHLGAKQKLQVLQRLFTQPSPPTLPSVCRIPPSEVGVIYALIQSDPRPIAKQTLQLIDSLAISSTQRV
jgi:tetratricopeptide (TPR) repeat protein